MYYKLNNITSKEMCDIVEAALTRSEMDNFLNPIGFDIFLELYMYESFYPDKENEIEQGIENDVFDTYDKLIKNGDIDKMHKEFGADIEVIYAYADKWFEKQSIYNCSAASAISQFADILGKNTDGLANRLKEALQNEELTDVFNIADKWGMGIPSHQQ